MSSPKVIETIKNFCEDFDYELRTNYSGRGMHGRECVGIVCGNPLSTLLDLCQYLVDEGIDDFATHLDRPATDNLGMSKIIYFRGLHDVVE